MRRPKQMQVGATDLQRFESVISATAYRALPEWISAAAHELRGRVIWNVNSTHQGGGVAELLRSLIAYARGGGIDARWVVIRGDPAFFELTKRLHNHLHGFDDEAGLGGRERVIYERTLAANAAGIVPLVRPSDIVILHDPQTAGLIEAIRRTGATVIWRCHVGMDRANQPARDAWSFLRPYVREADAYVFSRATFAWEGLPTNKIAVIQPSIDAFSAKNQPQAPDQSLSILARAGIVHGYAGGAATFIRSDGTPGRVDRRAELVEAAGLGTEDPLVVQVARWDRLKDPLGVMLAFAEYVAGETAAHLALAGPVVNAVSDDPEGARVFAEVLQAWRALEEGVRRRVHLVSLPMVDVEENAAIVNALQRQASVVVQKSLAEGFGLTVAEAMWKGRPVVGSRIGGIQDQIADGESGVLVSDPLDHAQFASAVVGLLSDPERSRRIGAAAHVRVRERFLAPHHLGRYFKLIHRLLAGPEHPRVADAATSEGPPRSRVIAST